MSKNSFSFQTNHKENLYNTSCINLIYLLLFYWIDFEFKGISYIDLNFAVRNLKFYLTNLVY